MDNINKTQNIINMAFVFAYSMKEETNKLKKMSRAQND